ncbi:MAG: hypothetical protein HUJ51_01410 [Eggerthellaceae bacterium]|nr:hypothetical protein [Eggerthellaceae bacterium]
MNECKETDKFIAEEQLSPETSSEAASLNPLDNILQISESSEDAESVETSEANEEAQKLVQHASSDQEEDNKTEDKEAKPKVNISFKHAFHVLIWVIKVLILVALLAVILFFVGFCLDKWIPNDHAKIIQGTWRVEPTAGSIQITENKFILDKFTQYDYDINTVDKNIVCGLNYYKGACKYRFSNGGDTLIIVDGDISFFQSLSSEIGWYFDKNIASLFTNGKCNIYIGYEKNRENNQVVTLDRHQ